MTARGRRVTALLLLGLGLSVAGCGKKGPPVAPERRLPVAPSAVEGAVEENSIVVSWANPGARVDNSRLRDLTTLRLFRHEEADGEPLKPAMLSRGQVVGYDEIATIRMAEPAPAEVQGGRARWVDRRGLSFGRRYVYVVTAEDSIGRSSPPSERLAITFLAAPKPPRGIAAAPGDRQVRLTWLAPAEFSDGAPVSGELRYVVLRGAGTEGPLSPVTPEPVATTSFTDTGLENDTDYRYAVRAVRADPRATATGEASAPVAVSPVKTAPPPRRETWWPSPRPAPSASPGIPARRRMSPSTPCTGPSAGVPSRASPRPSR